MKILVALMIWISIGEINAQDGNLSSNMPSAPELAQTAAPARAPASIPAAQAAQAQLQTCRQETAAFLSGDRSRIGNGQERAFLFLREFNTHLSNLAMECGSTVRRQDLTARGCDIREALRECLFSRNEAYLALLTHAGFIVERPDRSENDRFTKSTPPYEIDSIRILEPHASQPGR